jgi:hypothetical protein
MKKPLHQLTMEQTFSRAGGQPWRQEREQRPDGDVEQEEIEAARAWLAHVEAGRTATGDFGNAIQIYWRARTQGLLK